MVSAAPLVVAVLNHHTNRVPLARAARELAGMGVPIFPCAPDGKTPIVAHGFLRATTDPRQVESWWRWQPEANIGLPTGSISGLVVIDVDVHHVNGYAAFAQATRAGLIPTPLAIVRTPTGGRHVYISADPAGMQRSWTAGRVGVDFRGDGGYVIAPPSTLLLGGQHAHYRTEQTAAGATEPVDAARLRDFLDPRRAPRPFPTTGTSRRAADANQLADWVARQVKGDRNQKLFWVACRLAESNVPASEALNALVKAAKADFGKREITRTVYNAYRNVGADVPRRSALSASPGADRPAGRGPGPRAPGVGARAVPDEVPGQSL